MIDDGDPEETPEAQSVVDAALSVLINEQERAGMEGIFTLAVRLGLMLNQWAKMMSSEHEGEYSKEWVEQTGMTIFHKFFSPFVEPCCHGGDDA
jgi:hypothetical protein